MGNEKEKPMKPRRIRGTAVFHDDDAVEFIPQGKGEPVQRAVRKHGESKLYETEGDKTSSYVAHLKVNRDTADPRAELFDQLEHLTSKMNKDKEGLLTPPVKCLEKTDCLKIWHNRRTKKVIVQMEISLDSGYMPSKALYQLTAATDKCFVINETSLVPQKK